MTRLNNGAIIHPATIFKNGFEDINLVLYEMPAPKTAADSVWVFESGICKIVAISTKTVEDSNVTVVLGYLIKKSS